MTRRSALPIAVLALSLCACVPAASASLAGFRSPSGNIGCYVYGQGARCDIRNKDWEAPPTPPSCELDWGFGLTVDRHGRGNYVCAGDTAIDPSNPVLRYGDRITRGRFRCKSKQSGIRCTNRRNGHGFKISRQRAQLF
jgi:hypothetical protein